MALLLWHSITQSSQPPLLPLVLQSLLLRFRTPFCCPFRFPFRLCVCHNVFRSCADVRICVSRRWAGRRRVAIGVFLLEVRSSTKSFVHPSCCSAAKCSNERMSYAANATLRGRLFVCRCPRVSCAALRGILLTSEGCRVTMERLEEGVSAPLMGGGMTCSKAANENRWSLRLSEPGVVHTEPYEVIPHLPPLPFLRTNKSDECHCSLWPTKWLMRFNALDTEFSWPVLG